MKDNGKIMKNMDKEHLYKKMEMNIKEIGKMGYLMEMDYLD